VDLRYPYSKEIEYDWSEPSCARVSHKLAVEPDGSHLNLRVGPATEFKVKVKLPAGPKNLMENYLVVGADVD
jgi:hypothetical protein